MAARERTEGGQQRPLLACFIGEAGNRRRSRTLADRGDGVNVAARFSPGSPSPGDFGSWLSQASKPEGRCWLRSL